MAKEIDTSQDRQLSTNYNGAYSLTQFIPVEEVETVEGTAENYLDLLDWRFTQIMRSITDFSPVRFDGSLPLTTVCFKHYGNTTMTGLVVIYNGFMSPLDVPPGIIIKMPDKRQIDEAIIKLKQDKTKSQVRTIVI